MKKVTVLSMFVIMVSSIMNAHAITKNSFSHSKLPAQVYYKDDDNDGYGSSSDAGTIFNVDPGPGYSLNSTDCDDNNKMVNPGATEVCNYVDDDCNGEVDESGMIASVTPAGLVTFCTTLTLTANSDAGTGYQWYRNMTAIDGATNSNYTTTDKGNYIVLEKKGKCSAKSTAVSATLVDVPAANVVAYGALDLCNTGSLMMRANSGANYTYQWLKSGLVMSGCTSRNVAITCTGVYSVKISNSANCSATSSTVTVFSSCRENSEQAGVNPALSLFPNPSNGNFSVEMNLGNNIDGIANIEVLNILNQSVYTSQAAVINGVLQEQVKLNNSAPSGAYFVRLTIGDRVLTQRIIYQKQD